MNIEKDVTIIIPTLNEGKTIYNVIKAIPPEISRRAEILVIDGNSTDKTVSEAKRAGSRVIIEPKRGKGSAMIRGIKEAKGNLCLFMDGDGSLNPKDIPKFLAMNGYDYVLGSRFMDGIWKNTHIAGNLTISMIASVLFLRRITDINCGFKLIKTEVARSLNLESEGFDIEAEMLLKIIKKGYKFREIPIDARERMYGETNLSAIQDGCRIIKRIIRLKISKEG